MGNEVLFVSLRWSSLPHSRLLNTFSTNNYPPFDLDPFGFATE